MGILQGLFKKLEQKGITVTAASAHTDPVCGMKAGTAYSSTFNGVDYFFCSEHCKRQFDQSPAQFAK